MKTLKNEQMEAMFGGGKNRNCLIAGALVGVSIGLGGAGALGIIAGATGIWGASVAGTIASTFYGCFDD